MNSIGSFAEDLIKKDIDSIHEGKTVLTPGAGIHPDPDMRDISRVEVPQDFMDNVLGKKSTSIQESTSSEEQLEKKDSPELHTKKFSELVEEFSQVISQAQSILQEITACGGIGVNMGGGEESKVVRRSDTPRTINKELVSRIVKRRGTKKTKRGW